MYFSRQASLAEMYHKLYYITLKSILEQGADYLYNKLTNWKDAMSSVIRHLMFPLGDITRLIVLQNSIIQKALSLTSRARSLTEF